MTTITGYMSSFKSFAPPAEAAAVGAAIALVQELIQQGITESNLYKLRQVAVTLDSGLRKSVKVLINDYPLFVASESRNI